MPEQSRGGLFSGTSPRTVVPTGPRGPQGEPGPAATITSQAINADGNTEITFSDGTVVIVNRGPIGPTGGMGPRGDNGTDGTDGDTGPQGPQGPRGQQGLPGPQGPRGLTGLTGADGSDGSDGLPGAQGPAGPAGPTGPAGPAGPRGSRGEKGDTGPRGYRGLPGADGSDGARGLTGPQGPQGPQGLRGPAGADGADGAQGPQGEQGDPGPVGPRGLGLNTTTSFGADFGRPLDFVDGGGNRVFTIPIHYTDGTSAEFQLSIPLSDSTGGSGGGTGAPGRDGRDGRDGIGIQNISRNDQTGVVTITLTDGSIRTFALPSGPQGAQGPRGLTGPQGPIGPQGPVGPPSTGNIQANPTGVITEQLTSIRIDGVSYDIHDAEAGNVLVAGATLPTSRASNVLSTSIGGTTYYINAFQATDPEFEAQITGGFTGSASALGAGPLDVSDVNIIVSSGTLTRFTVTPDAIIRAQDSTGFNYRPNPAAGSHSITVAAMGTSPTGVARTISRTISHTVYFPYFYVASLTAPTSTMTMTASADAISVGDTFTVTGDEANDRVYVAIRAADAMNPRLVFNGANITPLQVGTFNAALRVGGTETYNVYDFGPIDNNSHNYTVGGI